MRALGTSTRLQLVTTLFVLSLPLIWFFTVPDRLSPLSFTLLAGLLGALATVGLITYKNAQAPSSMARLIHETDIAPKPGARSAANEERPQA